MKRTGSATGVMIKRTTLPELFSLWSKYGENWQWHNPFTTPPWLKSWWRHFGADNESLILLVSEGTRPLGVAPLMVRRGIARFIGSIDLCDTGDFIAAPGGRDFFSREILGFLEAEGVHCLTLERVRPDSLVYHDLVPAAREKGWRVSVTQETASVQTDLPASWEEYIQSLVGKQRHEVRRKLRRANEAGVRVQSNARTGSETEAAMDSFVHLFRQSREDKKKFMTDAREGFFRTLAAELSQFDMLSLHTLTVNDSQVAAVFCVEIGKTTYLYNNGFDPRFRTISLGVVSKIETIRASIEAGKAVYDFLGGTERYKFHLGGMEVPLMKCIIQRE